MTKCSFPVLNLYFQFALNRYSLILKKLKYCTFEQDQDSDILKVYIDRISKKKKYNIFSPHKYMENNTINKKIVAKSSTYKNHENIKDKQGLCQKISNTIFSNIMSYQTFDTNTLDCDNFFPLEKINKIQTNIAQELMSNNYRDIPR